jgi:WD40 repeat protein
MLLLEIILAVVGIVFLAVGKINFSARTTLEGPAVRFAGVILLLPFPIAFLAGFLIGINAAAGNTRFDPESLKGTLVLTELAILGGCVTLATLVLAGFARRGSTGAARHRRYRDERAERDAWDDRDYRPRRDRDVPEAIPVEVPDGRAEDYPAAVPVPSPGLRSHQPEPVPMPIPPRAERRAGQRRDERARDERDERRPAWPYWIAGIGGGIALLVFGGLASYLIFVPSQPARGSGSTASSSSARDGERQFKGRLDDVEKRAIMREKQLTDAELALRDAERARQEAERARLEADRARQAAEAAAPKAAETERDNQRLRNENAQSRQEVEKVRRDLVAARTEGDRAKNDATAARAETTQANRDRTKAEAEAGSLRRELDKIREKTADVVANADAPQQADRHLYFHQLALADREWRGNDTKRAFAFLDECKPELRQWEWRYLRRAIEGSAFTIDFDEVGRPQFSPDGRFIVTTNFARRALRVTDARTGQEVFTIRHTNSVQAASFSPDGKTLIGMAGGKVCVWDVEKRNLLAEFGNATGLIANQFSVSADGQRAATGRRSNDGAEVSVWDVEKRQATASWKIERYSMASLALSPDGKYLVAGGGRIGANSGLDLFDASTGKVVRNFAGLHGAATFSADGRHLAASTRTGIKVVEVDTGKDVVQLNGHPRGHTALAFSADGKLLATCGYDLSVRLWDLGSGQERQTFWGHRDLPAAVVFSPTGETLMSSGSYSTANAQRGEAKLWQVAAQAKTAVPGQQGNAEGMAWSPDGSRLAVAFRDGQVAIVDARTGATTRTLRGHKLNPQLVEWSPDGKRLLSAARRFGIDNTPSELKIWDVDAEKVALELTGHTWPVTGIAWSPDGSRIVTVGHGFSSTGQPNTNGEILVWDALKGEKVRTVTDTEGVYYRVAITADGRFFVQGTTPMRLGIVKAWSLKGEEAPAKVVLGQNEDLVLAVHPDGSRIGVMTLGGKIRVLEWPSGKELAVLRGPAIRANSLRFSPDGQRLVTAEMGGMFAIWDPSTGCEALRLRAFSSDVRAAAISPDGFRLATIGSSIDPAETGVRIWDGSPRGSADKAPK